VERTNTSQSERRHGIGETFGWEIETPVEYIRDIS
jgi:hypothetical protein